MKMGKNKVPCLCVAFRYNNIGTKCFKLFDSISASRFIINYAEGLKLTLLRQLNNNLPNFTIPTVLHQCGTYIWSFFHKQQQYNYQNECNLVSQISNCIEFMPPKDVNTGPTFSIYQQLPIWLPRKCRKIAETKILNVETVRYKIKSHINCLA